MFGALPFAKPEGMPQVIIAVQRDPSCRCSLPTQPPSLVIGMQEPRTRTVHPVANVPQDRIFAARTIHVARRHGTCGIILRHQIIAVIEGTASAWMSPFVLNRRPRGIIHHLCGRDPLAHTTSRFSIYRRDSSWHRKSLIKLRWHRTKLAMPALAILSSVR